MPTATPEAAETLANDLRATLDAAVSNMGTTSAVEPGPRVKLQWPPHAVSRDYRVRACDWTEATSFEAYGETFEVEVARTGQGIFVRCETLWQEARGETLDEAMATLRNQAEPLFERQFAISRALGLQGRFHRRIHDLSPIELLQLLYCEIRDVAAAAAVQIETHASSGLFFPSLLAILSDRHHPYRRSAQWCVLDLFEDLPSFAHTPEEQSAAVVAMKGLLWDAEDDYCRTVYKAGVVLGGHVSGKLGGPALLSALNSPSRIGRRSAIHGLFHAVEWSPELRDIVVWALSGMANSDSEPVLRQYASGMARNIAKGKDHGPDPVFD